MRPRREAPRRRAAKPGLLLPPAAARCLAASTGPTQHCHRWHVQHLSVHSARPGCPHSCWYPLCIVSTAGTRRPVEPTRRPMAHRYVGRRGRGHAMRRDVRSTTRPPSFEDAACAHCCAHGHIAPGSYQPAHAVAVVRAHVGACRVCAVVPGSCHRARRVSSISAQCAPWTLSCRNVCHKGLVIPWRGQEECWARWRLSLRHISAPMLCARCIRLSPRTSSAA